MKAKGLVFGIFSKVQTYCKNKILVNSCQLESRPQQENIDVAKIANIFIMEASGGLQSLLRASLFRTDSIISRIHQSSRLVTI